MQERLEKRTLWLTIILPFAMGFFVSMAFKCINAILAHPLMDELSLASVDVGWVTSLFMFTFALMQLPLGLVLDRWGPRRTQSVLFVIGAVGITVFGLATDLTMLALGRAIVGIGMAGGLMAALKATADWCDPKDLPFYNGIVLGVGGLGALMVTSPAKFFEIEFGWRALCFAMAALTLLVAAYIFFAGRDNQRSRDEVSDLRSDLAGLKSIYTNRFFWQLAPLLIVCNGSFIALLGLWLGPWLQHVVGFSPLQSAHYLFAISFAMAVGFASGGFIARVAERLAQPLIVIVIWGITIYITIQIILVMNFASQNYLIWVAYGISAKASAVGYAVLARHFGPKLSGRVVTAVNIFVALFAFATQYIFGLVLHLWPADADGTIPPTAYQAAYSGLIVLHVLALAWFVLAGGRLRARTSNG